MTSEIQRTTSATAPGEALADPKPSLKADDACAGEPHLPDEQADATASARSTFIIEEEQGRLASNLPPVDGGRGAWSYLIAATVLEMLVWGEVLEC